MKKIKSFIVMMLVIVISMLAGACVDEYKSRNVTTKKGEGYVYSLGEKAEFVNRDTSNIVATLKIDSCKLISDTPFVVKEQHKTKVTNDSGEEKTVTEWTETEYIGLYEVNFTYDCTEEYNARVSGFFSADETYFKINPKEDDALYGKFYIGAREGNDGDDVISLSFDYYSFGEPTRFDIPVDKLVLEKSKKKPKVIYVVDGEKVSKKEAEKSN